jgi:SAM-dependent methyltransferase
MAINGSLTCNLCGGSVFIFEMSVKDYVSLESFKLLCCKNCGLVFVNPPPIEAIARYYPPEIYKRGAAINSLGTWLRRIRSDRYLGDVKPGKVLEIGCGNGRDLLYLKKKGWHVIGTELSESSSAAAKSAGLEVHNASLEELKFPNGHFDVIMMWHVIEHLPAPWQTLQEAHRILKPNGILLLACPNYRSIDVFFAKERAFLEVPRHLYHFTESTLQQLLSDSGFEITSMHWFSLEIGVVSTMQSLLNILPLTGLTPNFILDWLGAGLYHARLEKTYKKHLLANVILMLPIGFLSFFLVAGAAWFRFSPTIELSARRTG